MTQMLHDELLEILEHTAQDGMTDEPILKALLAVVKMHYPHEITWAVKEPFIACYSCAEEYPCPTIDTIIEELV